MDLRILTSFNQSSLPGFLTQTGFSRGSFFWEEINPIAETDVSTPSPVRGEVKWPQKVWHLIHFTSNLGDISCKGICKLPEGQFSSRHSQNEVTPRVGSHQQEPPTHQPAPPRSLAAFLLPVSSILNSSSQNLPAQ